MKRLFIGLSTVLAVASTAQANARSNLEGRWKNGKMEIVIHPCGGGLCGTVVKASLKQQERAQNGSGTHLLGARVIDNIRPAGPGSYKADVYLADRDMNARGTIQMVTANRLEVRGCVWAIICKTTHWDRIG